MAQFFNTPGTAGEIVKLIQSSDDKLILISPYIKFDKKYDDLLRNRDDRKLSTTIIYGKEQELQDSVTNLIQNTKYIDIKFYKDLHAKCYANSSKIIITSLNLYDFSI
ncbi:MAG: hypothetical protein EBX41_05510 [Chitinophagia bacterium]|nr:hypothetical protein [Chitinophagia bacterium]